MASFCSGAIAVLCAGATVSCCVVSNTPFLLIGSDSTAFASNAGQTANNSSVEIKHALDRKSVLSGDMNTPSTTPQLRHNCRLWHSLFLMEYTGSKAQLHVNICTCCGN